MLVYLCVLMKQKIGWSLFFYMYLFKFLCVSFRGLSFKICGVILDLESVKLSFSLRDLINTYRCVARENRIFCVCDFRHRCLIRCYFLVYYTNTYVMVGQLARLPLCGLVSSWLSLVTIKSWTIVEILLAARSGGFPRIMLKRSSCGMLRNGPIG